MCRVCVLASRLDRLERDKQEHSEQVEDCQEELKGDRKQRKALDEKVVEMEDELAARVAIAAKIGVRTNTGAPSGLVP